MAYATPSSVQSRKRRVRSRLLDSAAELFARQGYAGTSMQQIVAHAGTSIGNCYFYFRDKEALLCETAKRLCRRVDLRISKVAKVYLDPHARMAASLWIGSELMIRHDDLARILFIEAPKTAAREEVLRFLRRRVEISFAVRAEQGGRLHERSPAAQLLRDPAFITVVWTGAVAAAFEAVARGEIAFQPKDLGRKLVWWNLGALGLPPGRIEAIIADLAERLGDQPIEIGGKA